MRKNIKEKISYFIFGISFIFLLIASESIYVSNNDLDYLRKFFLFQARSSALKNNADKAFTNLFRATNLRVNQQLKTYNEIFSKEDFENDRNSIVNSSYDKTVYVNYLKNIDVNQIFESKDIDFLRIFYDLALIASKNGYKEDILPFLKISMYMGPDLSHVHIEIANYYLLLGKIDLAIKQIDKCMTLRDPSYHCEQYRNDLLQYNETFEMGSLKEGVDEQYK
jgi:hypothetical protein